MSPPMHDAHPITSPCTVRRVNGFPDLLRLYRHDPERYPHLLESVARGTSQARFDILFAFPGETLELAAPDTLRLDGLPLACAQFLDNLDHWWAAEKCSDVTDPGIPFHGGWFLFLGYELAAQIEPRLNLPAGEPSFPVALATRIPVALIRDHGAHRTVVVAEPGYEDRIDVLLADLAACRELPEPPADCLAGELGEDAPQRYLDGVRRIHDYIVEGDVFQVNLSRAWRARLAAGVDAATLYQRLRRHNPAPFAGLATHADGAVISSSPERLVRVEGGDIETRPIAGTRPRSGERALDEAYSAELLGHPKERAEHIMLIDLERNDLGRVCRPGSVQVNELMALESYTHVHHIVSNVRGRLHEGVTPGEVIRAVFPGGTITGCPKVRCMEIIAELEQEPRGPYTGSMGYLNRDGSLDLNILIRTLVRHGDCVTLRAGAGIVADSIPERELEETRAKALGMLYALRS